MGLSASQARMLSLTSRLSDLELRAQNISNCKIRLADQAEQASQDYSDALDKQKLKVYSGLQSNGSASYIDATLGNLTTYNAISVTDKQRIIKNSAGVVLTSNAIVLGYKCSLEDDAYYDANVSPGYSTRVPLAAETYRKMPFDQLIKDYRFFDYITCGQICTNLDGDSDVDWDDLNILASKDPGKIEYYRNLYVEMLRGGAQGVSSDNMNSSEWLQSQIDAGNLHLYEYDSTGGTAGTGDYVNISWTSGDSSLSEETDDTQTAKAEAVYETTMASIQSKDKRFDVQLSSIDTEHTAVQTEVESVKKVISKNIERSLKLFDA